MGEETKMKYIATLKYAKLYDREIEASSLEEAQRKATLLAEQEDSVFDSDDREVIVLLEVKGN